MNFEGSKLPTPDVDLHPVRSTTVTDSDDSNDEDFASLFAASAQTRPLKTGQTVDGAIVAIGPEVALVDVGAKGEASIAVGELKNDDGALEFKVGDRIQATIVSTQGGVTLSRRLQRGAATRQQFEDAFRAGLPVEGKVESQVKGGYTVTIAQQRAFCPGSQIDTRRDTDPASHVGRVLTFRIIEYAEGGRKFVVSRRALLEEEQKARAEEVRRTLTPGAVITGRVASVRDFGAFVDLGGGVQGLLHISEMGWSRVQDPSLVAKPGDEITVKVLRIDGDKIALGLKQLVDDPWSSAAGKFPTGQVARGRVSRVAEFGVFAELEPGVVGLVPRSEAGIAGDADLKKAFPLGTVLDVMVLECDPANRRIRLSVTGMVKAEEAADVRDYVARATDTGQSSAFGSLADKLRGALKQR
jgi:small subunit ribosomal protein S1